MPLSALNHPNIVVIHEVGETSEGDHFIVQELIDGSTLRVLLEGPMPLTRIAEIGSQMRARSTPRTARVSCIATSSRRTSCSAVTDS